jgi:hypothetical protein
MAQTRSRRGVLSFAGLLPLAIVPPLPAIAADPNPDAELIAACAEFDRLEAAQRALNGAENLEAEAAADEARTPLYEAQDALVDRMHSIRAVTLAGTAALARSLVGWAPDLVETQGDIESLLLSAILRGLTGISATRAAEVHREPPLPLLLAPTAIGTAKGAEIDGELLGLCAELEERQAEVSRVETDPTDGDLVKLDVALDDWWETVVEITDTPARTPEGV